MCLFSHATYLIRSCNDPFICALNQQSTTIHEACPSCGKLLQSNDGSSFDEDNNVRRICRSCRKRVGMCFLCHEPVKGMYVWCPGCGKSIRYTCVSSQAEQKANVCSLSAGHGGHLDHALQWFGGGKGTAVREVCPTGCGHKCNLLQHTSAFPRTSSLNEFVPTQSSEHFDVFSSVGFI